MFTGLIADLGQVLTLELDDEGATLEIATVLAREIGTGDSVAVNGVCLTAVAVADDKFQVQAMAPTLRQTSLECLEVGAQVNLELALRADGRLGGHIVQGHVDGTGTVEQIAEEGFARRVRIELAPQLNVLLVKQGSVAVNGVSLTVSDLDDDGFSVSLIPETLTRTTLGEVKLGERVNVEVDILAKHIARLMEATRI